MKKYLPIILIGVVMVGLAAGGWFLLKGRSEDSSSLMGTEVSENVPAGEDESMSVSGKLADLISLGQAVKCTWQDVENNTGVAFVKGDKVYTESLANGVKSYYLQRDDCTWMWQEGQAQGYKICVEPDEETEVEEETEMPQGFSMNTGTMSYNCVPQIIDDTRFEAPTGIEFVDFAQMMQMNLPGMVTTP